MGVAAESTSLLLLLSFFWWAFDLESLGSAPVIYATVVRFCLSVGVLLFIVSEVLVFFGLFWAYFHTSLNPSPELGGI